jgi:general secretion pathway protein D
MSHRRTLLLLASILSMFWFTRAAPGQGRGKPEDELPAFVAETKAQDIPAFSPVPRKVPVVGEEVNIPLVLVEFCEMPLNEAMRLLSQQSGLKIVPSAEAAKTKVSLYLKDVAPLVAVAAMAQANNLIYRRDADTGIVRIFTTKENQIDLANFREEQTEVFTLLYPNAVNAATAIRDLFGSRVLLGYGASDNFSIQDLQQRFQRFDLINSRSLGLGIFQGNNVGTGGVGIGGVGVGGVGVGNFGGGGLTGVGGGMGFSAMGAAGLTGGTYAGMGAQGLYGSQATGPMRDPRDPRRTDLNPQQRLEGLTAEEIQELENAFTTKEAPDRTVLLDLLRRRPATIFVTIVKEHNQLIVRTSDSKTMDQIRELVYKIDVPTPVVLLEVKVLSIDLKDDFNSVFDYQFTDGILTSGGFTTDNLIAPFADKSLDRYTPINAGPLGNAPSNNLTFQVVSKNFRARMQLLESKNRVTELATPLLMTANNEVSRIFSGETVPITVGFTPSQIIANGVSPSTSVTGTPVTTLQDIGTSLLITPNINADRTVTLRILEENSTVNPNGGKIPVPSVDGTVTQVQVDTVLRQNVVGTVVAADGMAIALGGLIQEGVADTRSEVPILGKIPYLGFFFRRQATERTRKELIIMVRPFVLTTPCESKASSHNILEAISIHPLAPQGGFGSLGTYTPPEVLRPNPPETPMQNIFRLHTILPKDF